jgi:hypothetical protein
MRTNRILAGVTVLAMTGAALAAVCPDAVKTAATKAHPGASVTKCRSENEKGAVQYVVAMKTPDGRSVEVDASVDGRILKTEEAISVDKIPETVRRAFQSRYGDARAVSVEKETLADGKVDYEIAYWSGIRKKEITIAEDGTVIEEE